ncbi:MAG TPA: hypothetical protein VIO60_06985 [Rectinemataceae bacterium]
MGGEDRKRVYDYNRQEVRQSLMAGFRKKGKEATVADLAAVSGLPLQQIEAELPALADEYGARLRVTDTGEILYSFPRGMHSRYRGFKPAAAKALRAAAKGAAALGKAMFKGWIVLMLVGYFVLFIAIALFALVASVVVQQGGGRGRDDRRGGGLGGLWLTTRLFDSLIRIWFYSELFKPAGSSRIEGGGRPKRPLHKAVFSFVFGDGDPNQGWERVERKAVLAFLRTHKGLMSIHEFMAITGKPPLEAEEAINSYLLEFEGSPEVSESGTLYYSFPKILARADQVGGQGLPLRDEAGGEPALPLKRLEAFSSNAPKADRSFRLINLANLGFGSYFLYNALSIGAEIYVRTPRGLALRPGFGYLYAAAAHLFRMLGAADPIPGIIWGLGIVPLAFSAFFFAIPALRAIRLKRKNEVVKLENLRRLLYGKALEGKIGTRDMVSPIPEASPNDPRAASRMARELAAWLGSGAEPEQDGFILKEISRVQKDMAGLRSKVDASAFGTGMAIFDTES